MTTTRKPRSSKKSTPVVAPAAPAATATAEAPRPSLASQLVLNELFLEDGTFTERDVFKYNSVTGGALVKRRAIFGAIAMAKPEEINALSRKARNTIFALIKGETQRYLGTATRRSDSQHTAAKRGDPLPKLSFPTPVEAVSYRAQLKRAMDNMRLAVFGTLEDTRPQA